MSDITIDELDELIYINKDNISISSLFNIVILYSELHGELINISNFTIKRKRMKEGFNQIENAVTDEELIDASNKIKVLVKEINDIEKNIKFDQPNFVKIYRGELEIFEMVMPFYELTLNMIWDNGKPAKYIEIPLPVKILNAIKFYLKIKGKRRNETTNYEDIFCDLANDIKTINSITKLINVKTRGFNKLNKDIDRLPKLSLLPTLPRWVAVRLNFNI